MAEMGSSFKSRTMCKLICKLGMNSPGYRNSLLHAWKCKSNCCLRCSVLQSLQLVSTADCCGAARRSPPRGRERLCRLRPTQDAASPLVSWGVFGCCSEALRTRSVGAEGETRLPAFLSLEFPEEPLRLCSNSGSNFRGGSSNPFGKVSLRR